MERKANIDAARLFEALARIVAEREGCRVSVTVTERSAARSA